MHASTDPVSRRRRRWPLALLLLLCLAFLGLGLGTSIGAACCVPEGSGLAGPAIALGYGVLGAGIGLALGGLLAWRAGHGLLRGATLVAAFLTLCALGWSAWRMATLRAEQRAATGQDVPLPPPASFRFVSSIAETGGPRAYRELTVDASTWTVTWTAVGPEAATCRARLVFDEADALFGKRTEILESEGRYGSECSPAGPGTHRYALYEGAGEPVWELVGDGNCLQTSPSVAALHFLLARIPTNAVDHGRARCDL
jgi:hypothetical protein